MNRLHVEQKRTELRSRLSEAEIQKVEELEKPLEVKGRRTLSDFMNTIKDGLIDLFKEEGDKKL
jgi:hypothetical protein